MKLSWRRIRAIVRKEFREYRRNRSVISTMVIFPLIFLIQPVIVVNRLSESTSTALSSEHLLLYMLAIPIFTPAMLAAYSVAGERAQGSLEPVLTTPIRREEFLIGKALAVLVPSIAVAYLVYAAFLVWTVFFTEPGVASAIIKGPDLVAQILFTPLLACLFTWVGIAISTRTSPHIGSLSTGSRSRRYQLATVVRRGEVMRNTLERSRCASPRMVWSAAPSA